MVVRKFRLMVEAMLNDVAGVPVEEEAQR